MGPTGHIDERSIVRVVRRISGVPQVLYRALFMSCKAVFNSKTVGASVGM